MADETPNELMMSRRDDAASAFVQLVGALVDDFDVIEMLTVLSTRCVELLHVAAAGILLADPDGTLRVIGASNEQAQLLELLQVQNEEGPCIDCFSTGYAVSHPDLTEISPWPRFAVASVAEGYLAVSAVPLRLRESRIGCLNLFMSAPEALPDSDIALAQALADVATIAILQDQSTRDATLRQSQLQHALDSRIVIEQAKGMIAVHLGVGMDAAFARLRSHARNHNLRLTDLAAGITNGSISLAVVSPDRRPPPGPPRRS